MGVHQAQWTCPGPGSSGGGVPVSCRPASTVRLHLIQTITNQLAGPDHGICCISLSSHMFLSMLVLDSVFSHSLLSIQRDSLIPIYVHHFASQPCTPPRTLGRTQVTKLTAFPLLKECTYWFTGLKKSYPGLEFLSDLLA